LCAIVFYRKRINGQLYPKAARTGPYAFAQEVKRANGKVVTRYLGILKVPDKKHIEETDEHADSPAAEDCPDPENASVIEEGGEGIADRRG